MANFKIKRLPQIKLVDLLKKRKTTLKRFVDDYGIVTHSTLITKCDSMGVSPPSEAEFKKIVNVAISSPQEGIVVLDSPALLSENTGELIMVDDMGGVHSLSKKILEILPVQQSVDETLKKNKNPKIDESTFVTSIGTLNIETSTFGLGETTSVEDDIDSSALKLSMLKNLK
jgi:hypothetical protein